MAKNRVHPALAGAATVVALVAVVALAAALLAPTPDSGGASQEAGASATSATSSTAPATTEVRNEITCYREGKEIPCLPENEQNEVADIAPRALTGWGGSQPYKMAATTQYGSTDTPLTAERRVLLGKQLEQARRAGMAIGTVAEAERQGFVKNFQWIDGRGYEYINWDRFTSTFDLDKPSLLAAAGDDPDSPIVSIAYNVLGSREDGPPDLLPLEYIPWHYHHNLCRAGDSVIGNVETKADGTLYEAAAKRCLEAGATYLPELDNWMVDLWVIPGWENPWGLVSSKHPDLFRDPQPYFPDATTTTTAPAPTN